MNSLFSSSIGGVQDKYIEDGFLYKIDRDGYESIAEAVVSELCRHIVNMGEFVDYELTEKKGVCRCKLLADDIVTFYDILKAVHKLKNFELENPRDRLILIEKALGDFTGRDYHDFIRKVIFLDYIILNEDRHLGNFHILKRNGIYDKGIIIDNRLSLLSNISTYDVNRPVRYYIISIRSKPFSTNRNVQVDLFKGEELLKIDIDRFNRKINSILNKDDIVDGKYNEKYLFRSLRVVQYMLSRTEGLAWKRI